MSLFSMPLAGLHKLTTLDYPGVVSAIVFVQGCNFHCPYCHNPHLIPFAAPQAASLTLKEEDLAAFLQKRAGLLDGLVISGGEPTMHDGLAELCRFARSLGYKVKLDTNGSRPAVISKLLDERLLDYIAMDVKALPEDYGLFCNAPSISEAIEESIAIVKDSERFGAQHEFRTTCVFPYVSDAFVERTAKLVGSSPWFFQKANIDDGMAAKGLSAVPQEKRQQFVELAALHGASPALR